MQWDSYKAVEAGGQRYGMKSDSFGPYLELPARAGREFEIALGGPTAPRSLLERNGWHLRRSLDLSTDPWTYQRYIQSSRGEFSVAKHGYVVSRSGWFSERTAGYLASGRPAVVEDTGFSDWLPTGAGLLPFSSLEEALAGIAAIDGRYDFHCRAARALAQEHFDARVVLPGLIEQAMGARRE
jgi:hypothetical protein